MADPYKEITETVDGTLVKNLVWKETDNIIVGLVKDELRGNPNINDGYVGGQWRKNGTPTNSIQGRNELRLKF